MSTLPSIEGLAESFGYQIVQGDDGLTEIAQYCTSCVIVMPHSVWGKSRVAGDLNVGGLGGSGRDLAAIADHALDLFARWLHHIVGGGNGWRPAVVTVAHLDNIYPAQIRTGDISTPVATARFTHDTATRIQIDLEDGGKDIRLHHHADTWIITSRNGRERRIRPDGDNMLAFNTAELAWRHNRAPMLMRTAAAIDAAPFDPATAHTPAARYAVGLTRLREQATHAAARAIIDGFDEHPAAAGQVRLIRDRLRVGDPATLTELSRKLLRLSAREQAAACWDRHCHTGNLPYAQLRPLQADDVAELYAHTFHRAAANQTLHEIRGRFPKRPA